MVSQKAVLGIVIVLIIVGVAAFIAMGGGGLYGGIYGPPPEQEQQQAAEEAAQVEEGEVIEIEVDANEYSFNPATIRVKVGDFVRIKVTNVGSIFHTFTIDEFNINVPLNPGETKVIEFRADKSGTFVIYCVPHKPLGMVGDLIVEEG